MKYGSVGAICLMALTIIPSIEGSACEPEVGVAVSELGHHRGRSRAIPLLRGDSLWELSTAVAPPGSRGCTSGRFFVSVGLHGGGSTPGTGDNAVLLRGNLDCSSKTSNGDQPALTQTLGDPSATVLSCAMDQYQQTLFPLRSPSDPADQSFADNAMTRMPDGTILLLRDLALNTLPKLFPKLDDGSGLWASKGLR